MVDLNPECGDADRRKRRMLPFFSDDEITLIETARRSTNFSGTDRW